MSLFLTVDNSLVVDSPAYGNGRAAKEPALVKLYIDTIHNIETTGSWYRPTSLISVTRHLVSFCRVFKTQGPDLDSTALDTWR